MKRIPKYRLGFLGNHHRAPKPQHRTASEKHCFLTQFEMYRFGRCRSSNIMLEGGNWNNDFHRSPAWHSPPSRGTSRRHPRHQESAQPACIKRLVESLNHDVCNQLYKPMIANRRSLADRLCRTCDRTFSKGSRTNRRDRFFADSNEDHKRTTRFFHHQKCGSREFFLFLDGCGHNPTVANVRSPIGRYDSLRIAKTEC